MIHTRFINTYPHTQKQYSTKPTSKPNAHFGASAAYDRKLLDLLDYLRGGEWEAAFADTHYYVRSIRGGANKNRLIEHLQKASKALGITLNLVFNYTQVYSISENSWRERGKLLPSETRMITWERAE